MTTKQRIHLDNLATKRKAEAMARLQNALSYDMGFYKFKNGKLNVSKLARCAGLSRGFVERELWRLGL
ncbi:MULTISPECIES: hypothetical protein [Campylobacter]|uniref:hypothetical protein n=1 Tax=Campylobacter TaxID=194 RepID=UPI00027A3581|nr:MULTISPECIES: hypothetical protein [Campylobacter]EJP75066.1 hypothetical protein HMPREF1139_1504 [Campylobacter sp. FOBRC14]